MTAVLLSGGLDSAVLVAEEARRDEVQPIYVSAGLDWEQVEREAAQLFLAQGQFGARVRPLTSLTVDMSDVYPASHWARLGTPPPYHAADDQVFLPGRNIILLGKAAVFCALAGIHRLAIGTLAHNPFPDATSAFRDSLARALSLGLVHQLEIAAPFAANDKAEVIRRGDALPLGLTVSCLKPQGFSGGRPRHCGECNKCRERHEAFVEAGRSDPTLYDSERHFLT